eukprot:TRINITY_DN15388_c0_g1_i1.p1 TRINITY_DN15388_c0_g1~~TRINITY_DN15388_c0_g1_i1.p1  ORF type:complete len:230 (-),score=9.46 TRINITY_DN15388_c0_g1_i1:75-764(-)
MRETTVWMKLDVSEEMRSLIATNRTTGFLLVSNYPEERACFRDFEKCLTNILSMLPSSKNLFWIADQSFDRCLGPDSKDFKIRFWSKNESQLHFEIDQRTFLNSFRKLDRELVHKSVASAASHGPSSWGSVFGDKEPRSLTIINHSNSSWDSPLPAKLPIWMPSPASKIEQHIRGLMYKTHAFSNVWRYHSRKTLANECIRLGITAAEVQTKSNLIQTLVRCYQYAECG